MFFIIVHLSRCEVVSLCGCVCISLMTTNVEQVFMGLLTICISSLEKYLRKSFAHIWIVLFFLFLSCRNSLYIANVNPLSDTYDASDTISYRYYCLPYVDCLFTFLIISFHAEKFLVLMKSSWPLFFFSWSCFWCHI